MRLPWQNSREKELFKRSARSFADYYCEYADQHSADLALIGEEIGQIFSSIGIYIDHEVWSGVVKVVKATAGFLELQGYWDELSHAYQDAIEAAENYFGSLGRNPAPEAWHDRITLRSDLGLLYFLQGEYNKSEEIIQEALNFARRIKHRKLEALLLGVLGSIAITAGQYRKAEALNSEGKDIQVELGDQQGIVNALERLALVATSQGDHGIAAQITQERLLLVQEMGDHDQEAQVILELAGIAETNGDLHLADELFQKSVKTYQGTKNISGLAQVQYRRAKRLESRGDHDGAQKIYLEKLTLEQEQGDLDATLGTLRDLAWLALNQKSLDEASSYYQKAWQIAEDMGKLPDIAVILQGLGDVAHLQGEDGKALALYEESLRFAYACGYSKLINIALLTLSLYARRAENFELAEKYLQEVWALVEDGESEEAKAQVLRNLGDVTLVLDKYQVARDYFLKAQKIYASLGNQVDASLCLTQLSLIEILDDKLSRAWNFLMQALDIYYDCEDDELKNSINNRLKYFLEVEEFRIQAENIFLKG